MTTNETIPADQTPNANRPPLHFLQKWGAIAAMGSFFVGATILTLTYINFQSPETKRQEAILRELSYDFFASEGSIPLNSQDYRDAAAPYINRRLAEMNETWRFDPKTDRRVPFR
ncbi:hypothetical protein [Bradyrhizobium sp. dw_411]|uniref:hypothetical protein n=1 Tax=Bradyrhizobium sp. dw_411 TaxID=2720082 RepID=UPI001BCC6CAD|nr:hypothetical protein [Bradyrhizobium sp. dw_411]